MLIYILVFLICITIDKLEVPLSEPIKKLFLLFLYCFFCFGYTTGTDWRFYEELYLKASDYTLMHKNIDKGFYYFIAVIRKVIPDFWLFLGLVKGIYLYFFIRVIRTFTDKIFFPLGLLMVYTLLFMLVDNPLRFMIGSIFLLIATPQLVRGNIITFILLSSLSLLFHFSLAVPIIVSCLILFKDRLFNNRKLQITIYVSACIISLSSLFIFEFRQYLSKFFPALSSRLVEIYLIESNEANFTVGSILHVILFVLFLVKKESFLKYKYGKFLFIMSFLYFTLHRLIITLPTGFRFSIYLSIFFGISLYFILRESKLVLRATLVAIIGVSLMKDLYTSFQFIPYTNSIYYIVTDSHPPFIYRDKVNKIEYHQRTGKLIEDKNININY